MSEWTPEEEVFFMKAHVDRSNKTYIIPGGEEDDIDKMYYMLAVFFIYMLIIMVLVVKFAHKEKVTKHLDEKMIKERLLRLNVENYSKTDETLYAELNRVKSLPDIGYINRDDLIETEGPVSSQGSTNEQTGDFIDVTVKNMPLESLCESVDKKFNSLPRDFVMTSSRCSVESEFRMHMNDFVNKDLTYVQEDKPPWISPIKYPLNFKLKCLNKIQWL